MSHGEPLLPASSAGRLGDVVDFSNRRKKFSLKVGEFSLDRVRSPPPRSPCGRRLGSARTCLSTKSAFRPATRSKSITTSLPPGRSAWRSTRASSADFPGDGIRRRETPGQQIRQADLSILACLHRNDLRFAPALGSEAMWARKPRRDIHGVDSPVVPTFSAINRVNSPVPAPTSATAIPGNRPRAATISSRLVKTSRFSDSNRLMNSLTSGFLNGSLIFGSVGSPASCLTEPQSPPG